MSISIRIKELREKKKLSKKDFSSKIGVDNSQYGKFESGKLTPTIQQLMVISSNFGVSIDWLLMGEGNMLRGAEPVAQQSASEEVASLIDRIERQSEQIGELRAENKYQNEQIKKISSAYERLKNENVKLRDAIPKKKMFELSEFPASIAAELEAIYNKMDKKFPPHTP